ncbi:MAG: redoxin domain-containing protein [Halobacteriovoraceae bacterium]|nr:redoxin domain-containing protein [Halobacteriovoraceae bacterium]
MQIFLFISLTILSWITPLSLSASSPTAYNLRTQQVSKLDNLHKYNVLVFMQKSCPCSNNHFAHLKNLTDDFSEFFGFSGIILDSKETGDQELEKHFSKLGPKFDLFHDRSKKFLTHFKAIKTPHAFVVDKEGQILYHGGISNTVNPSSNSKFYLKEVLTKLIKSGKSPYEYKRAIGCYIKR